ncbi:hypothetical protein AB1Y20_022249 [Prymnesium parvum]|uniref:Uncharacterized protein n=1 Tax=Prymnesium parvum TaxID=97485 RepID=A0AB34JFC9_PRYPA
MVFEPPRLAARLSPRGAAAEGAARCAQRHTAAHSFPVRDLSEERWASAMEQAGRERSDEMTARLRERLERAELASREMLAELSDAHEAHTAIARELEEERTSHAALQSAHERMLELRAVECAAAAATIGQLEARLSDTLRGSRRDAWPPSEQEGRVGLGGEWELVLLRREMAAQEGQQAELEAALVDALEVSRLRRDALDASNAQVEQLCATANRWQELAIGATRRTEVVWSSLAAELHEDDSRRHGLEANSEEARALSMPSTLSELYTALPSVAAACRRATAQREACCVGGACAPVGQRSAQARLALLESELRVQLHKALRVSMARAADLEAVKETAAAATKRAEALAALLEKNGTLKLRSVPERDVAMASSLGELDRLEERVATGSSWPSGSEAVRRPAGGIVNHKAPGAKTTPQALLEATQAELAAARRASASWEERAHAFKAEWEALQRDRQVEREEAQRMIQEYDAHAASASLENAWKRIGAALAAAHYVHNAKAAHLQQCADLVSQHGKSPHHPACTASCACRHFMRHLTAAEAALRREIDAVTKMFATTLRLEEFKCVRLEDEVARLTSQLELATTTSRELDQKILMDRLSSEAALGSQERRFREEMHAVEERANRTRLVGELWREVLLVDLRAEEADRAARESRIKRCELLVAQQEKVQQHDARRAMALIAHAEADTLRCKKEVEAERAIARHVILQLESVGQVLSNELRSMSKGVHALESAQPHWHALHAQTVAAGVELRVVCKELALLERNHADLGCITRATSRDLSTAKRSLCVEFLRWRVHRIRRRSMSFSAGFKWNTVCEERQKKF